MCSLVECHITLSVWGFNLMHPTQHIVSLHNFSLQNTRKSLRVSAADIIHSHRKIKEILDPENSPFH